jgi:hypothetical protein
MAGDSHDLPKFLMQVVVSLIFIGFGIWVLSDTGSSEELQKLASGWLGLVIGYWLS